MGGRGKERERERVERRPNAVKGLVNTPPTLPLSPSPSLSLASRIPGCVGVRAQAGEVVTVNALQDDSRWQR